MNSSKQITHENGTTEAAAAAALLLDVSGSIADHNRYSVEVKLSERTLARLDNQQSSESNLAKLVDHRGNPSS